MMLRCINPKEADLLDFAAGIHIRFRLAGVIIQIHALKTRHGYHGYHSPHSFILIHFMRK